MNENNELPQLDLTLLEGYLASLNKKVVEQMITLYANQVAIYINDIESSLVSNDAQLWQEHCHKMKGAAGSVGLKSLHARVALMEKTADNLDEKAQQFTELKKHNQQAIADFNGWLEGV